MKKLLPAIITVAVAGCSDASSSRAETAARNALELAKGAQGMAQSTTELQNRIVAMGEVDFSTFGFSSCTQYHAELALQAAAKAAEYAEQVARAQSESMRNFNTLAAEGEKAKAHEAHSAALRCFEDAVNRAKKIYDERAKAGK